MYKLVAVNEQGASVEFNERSVYGCMVRFDNYYSRKGFKISIYTNSGEEKQIKKTFR